MAIKKGKRGRPKGSSNKKTNAVSGAAPLVIIKGKRGRPRKDWGPQVEELERLVHKLQKKVDRMSRELDGFASNTLLKKVFGISARAKSPGKGSGRRGRPKKSESTQ